jgi:hypothetical protein
VPHSSGAEPLCVGAHRRRVLKLLVVSVGLEFVFLSGGIILRGQGATRLVIVRGGPLLSSRVGWLRCVIYVSTPESFDTVY